MTTLTIHPITADQETAIRMFLDALHVDYNISEEPADTANRLSSKANPKYLQKSTEQGQKREVTKLHIDEIWKL